MLNRTKAPSFSQDFSFELPQPEIITVNRGSKITWLQGIQQDVFKIELVFNSSKWNEPVKGLSHFLALLLDKGTQTKTSNQISSILDYNGAQLEITPGQDFTSVSLYGLNKSLRAVFPVILDLVTNSIFPEDELQLQKDIFIQNLKVNSKKTSFIASKLLRQNLFGMAHPYGSSVEESDLQKISSDELVIFFRAGFNLKDVFLVGNFSNEDVKWLISQLENISSKKNTDVFTGQILQGNNTRAEEIKGVQATIRLGKRFVNRNHSDYAACVLANHILGGFFGSRLMKNIREDKGLTYGIYSSIQPLQRDAFLSIGADVNVDKIEVALIEIKNEIERLIQTPIAFEELATAKNHFLGSLQLEVSNPFSAIEKIKTVLLNDLSVNFYENLFLAIKDLNSAQLKSTTMSHMSPESFTSVVVS